MLDTQDTSTTNLDHSENYVESSKKMIGDTLQVQVRTHQIDIKQHLKQMKTILVCKPKL